MPGIRVEKLTASMVISRFIRRATSVKRSIWNPSTPPPSLGMAWGAKAPSTPVRSGAVRPAPQLGHGGGGEGAVDPGAEPRELVLVEGGPRAEQHGGGDRGDRT